MLKMAAILLATYGTWNKDFLYTHSREYSISPENSEMIQGSDWMNFKMCDDD